MKKFSGIFLSFLLAGGFLFSYEENRDLKLSSGGLQELVIDCGAGSLKVKGDKGAESIEVRATIHLGNVKRSHEKEFLEKYIRLSLKKEGNRGVLKSHVKSHSKFLGLRTKNVYIDLEVIMPADLRLDIHDGSGAISVRQVAEDVKIDDGSGSLEVVDCGGMLFIDDGSGEIVVKGIKGNMKIHDGSGELLVENAGGNVTIHDGSGGIRVMGAAGDVKIDDGSGSMRLTDIGGSVSIDDGTGDINVNGVEKDLVIEESGSGGVSIKNVKGKVETDRN